MQIDRNLILRLEALSKLELGEDERSSLIGDLNKIVAMIERLHELPTETEEPLIYITDAVNGWRQDEVNNQVSSAEALQNASGHDGRFFKVPKVL